MHITAKHDVDLNDDSTFRINVFKTIQVGSVVRSSLMTWLSLFDATDYILNCIIYQYYLILDGDRLFLLLLALNGWLSIICSQLCRTDVSLILKVLLH
jgi:hypothetical protein